MSEDQQNRYMRAMSKEQLADMAARQAAAAQNVGMNWSGDYAGAQNAMRAFELADANEQAGILEVEEWARETQWVDPDSQALTTIVIGVFAVVAVLLCAAVVIFGR